MKTIEELRKEFEETELFKSMDSTYFIRYSEYRGYESKHTGEPFPYLNGAFKMFQELNK